ncbi:MAG TPA: glycosyltransferase family 2 protein [Armatimonadota bacterium]|nr:glycosyltransferase family 2 protein [Armatimonadota bacterium]
MGSSAQVTVGIPTIGREYLRDAIESLLAQSFTDWHGIISDNSNSPKVRTLVESYGDKRLEYVGHPQNLGAGGNFNYIFDAATSEYCTILHDDDRYYPDYLQRMLEGMREHSQARWGFCNAWYCHVETGSVRPWIATSQTRLFPKDGALFSRLATQDFICCPTVMFHRDVYTQYRFTYDLSIVIDWELWLRLAHERDALFVDEPLLYYRQWPGNHTSECTKSGAMLFDHLVLFRWLLGLDISEEVRGKVMRERAKQVRLLCRNLLLQRCAVNPSYLSAFDQDNGIYPWFVKLAYRFPVLRPSFGRWAERYEARKAQRRMNDSGPLYKSLV